MTTKTDKEVYDRCTGKLFGHVVDESKLTNAQLCEAISDYEGGLCVVRLPNGSHVLISPDSDRWEPMFNNTFNRQRQTAKAAQLRKAYGG